MFNFSIKTKKKKLLISIVIIFLFCLSFIFSDDLNHFIDNVYKRIGIYKFANVDYENEISVHFIDVGQGDASLIRAKNYTILIDGGDYRNSTKLLKYINSMNIYDIDLMIISHYHEDHMGGLTYVLNSKNVKNVLMPIVAEDILPTTNNYKNFIELLISKNINVVNPTKFNSFKDGKLSIELFNNNLRPYKNLNDTSLVLKLKFGEVSFLFTGDIEKEAENYLLKQGFDISSTILKVAHHGSYTSTSERFLSAVSPKYSVISVGYKNRYKHPSPSVVKRLRAKNVDILRTDINKNIAFITNGTNIEVLKDE